MSKQLEKKRAEAAATAAAHIRAVEEAEERKEAPLRVGVVLSPKALFQVRQVCSELKTYASAPVKLEDVASYMVELAWAQVEDISNAHPAVYIARGIYEAGDARRKRIADLRKELEELEKEQ